MSLRAIDRTFVLAMALFFGGMVAGCQTEPAVTVEDKPAPVLLISIDGFRPDYFGMFDSPALDRLMREGLYADSLHQVFPTKTFPTHYSLVTGLHPGTHGVVANRMWDPRRKATFSLGDREAVGDGYWYQDGEPVWVTAEKQGLTAATFFWPGSEARIDRIRPTHWKPYAGDTPHEQRITQILEWAGQPAESRPDFMTLYFSRVDSLGHSRGPAAPAVLDGAAEIDRQLGRLLDGLEDLELLERMHIIIVSDHGMTAIDRERYIMLDDYLDLDRVRISDWGPAAQIWATDMSPDAIVEALADAHPRLRVWARDDIPERYRFGSHHRVPDVLAEADPGWMISDRDFMADRQPPAGMHGWDPAWGEMHGIFIARGPDFIPGTRAPAVRSVDLYALLTRLLDLDPAPHEGSITTFAPYLGDGESPDYRIHHFDCDAGSVQARIGPAHMSLHHAGYIFVLDRIETDHAQRFETVGAEFHIDSDRATGRIDGNDLGECRRRPALRNQGEKAGLPGGG